MFCVYAGNGACHLEGSCAVRVGPVSGDSAQVATDLRRWCPQQMAGGHTSSGGWECTLWEVVFT